MKLVKQPAPLSISLPGPEGDRTREVSFQEFLMIHLDGYAEAAKTPSQLRKMVKVVDHIEACKGKNNIDFEDADYDLVKAACERIQYVPRAARQLMKFYDAVEKSEELKSPKPGDKVG